MKRRAILLTLVLLLLLTQAAGAMSSASFSLDWLLPLTGGSGGEVSSANYAANLTLGQTVADDSSSTNYAVHMGFWQDFVNAVRLWLPMTVK
jgi:hypothetical protein